jgi:hypothetical protein
VALPLPIRESWLSLIFFQEVLIMNRLLLTLLTLALFAAGASSAPAAPRQELQTVARAVFALSVYRCCGYVTLRHKQTGQTITVRRCRVILAPNRETARARVKAELRSAVAFLERLGFEVVDSDVVVEGA